MTMSTPTLRYATPQAATLVNTSDANDYIGRSIGSYRIIGALGAGGCGSVWLAEHDVIASRVAIKILRPEVVALPGIQERFITEARAATAIPSPHVARYVDLGVLPTGEPYAIMEYLEGTTLHDKIEREGTLTIDESIALARQAAETLALAHERSIIHRDIKPENIFISSSGMKLLDFGIAKLVGDAMRSRHQTEVGQFIGTPAYCAPEQITGTAATASMDIYALGATLYEMLTGEPPHDPDAPDFLLRKVTAAPARVSATREDVPEELDMLVASMVHPHPANRPASMTAVAATLAAIAELEQPASEAPRAKRGVWSVIVALGAVNIALVIALLARPSPRTDHAVRFVERPVAMPVRVEVPVEVRAACAPPPPPPRPVVKKKSDVIIADPFR